MRGLSIGGENFFILRTELRTTYLLNKETLFIPCRGSQGQPHIKFRGQPQGGVKGAILGSRNSSPPLATPSVGLRPSHRVISVSRQNWGALPRIAVCRPRHCEMVNCWPLQLQTGFSQPSIDRQAIQTSLLQIRLVPMYRIGRAMAFPLGCLRIKTAEIVSFHNPYTCFVSNIYTRFPRIFIKNAVQARKILSLPPSPLPNGISITPQDL